MVNVAVIDVPLTTVVLLTVMPVPLRPIVAPDAKFVPVSVTPTVCPCVPELGLTELSVGAPKFTVNVCVPLVLPELVTVTFWGPVGAFEAMVNVAVIDVPLTTVVLLTVMPVPLRPIVAPDAKFVPVSVTPTVCPCVPELGLTELSVGAPKFTVNVCVPLVLPELVTVTFWGPVGAFEAMVNVAVIDVPLTTVVLLTVMPVPLRPIVAPDAKFAPVSWTPTVCPCVPELGLTELSVGAPKFTVNVCVPLVLPELVTVTFWGPVGAFEAMVNIAVIDVPLTTVVLLTVMPVPLRPIVAPDAKFVPVSVTPPVCPCVPELGLTELSVGAPKFTVNVCVPLVLPELVTVTFWGPVEAFEAMVNVAVLDETLTTALLLTVMPVPLRPIVAPDAKFVPVSVTATAAPWMPLFGAIEVSVGAPAFTVNVCVPLVPVALVRG